MDYLVNLTTDERKIWRSSYTSKMTVMLLICGLYQYDVCVFIFFYFTFLYH